MELTVCNAVICKKAKLQGLKIHTCILRRSVLSAFIQVALIDCYCYYWYATAIICKVAIVAMIISAKYSYNYLHGGTHLYAITNNQRNIQRLVLNQGISITLFNYYQ